jgi:hypothetical protein
MSQRKAIPAGCSNNFLGTASIRTTSQPPLLTPGPLQPDARLRWDLRLDRSHRRAGWRAP